MAAKMFIVYPNALEDINRMVKARVDQSYVVLSVFSNYSDIAQYDAKYDSIRLITVPTFKLDANLKI